MPKVKHGRRHHHYKPKNAERRWQSQSKVTPLQAITNIIEARDGTISSQSTRVLAEKNTSTADPHLAQSESTQNTSAAVTNTQCITRTAAEPSNSQENITCITERDHPYSQFDRVKADLPQSLSGWHLYMSNDTIQLSLICNAPPEPSVVKTTLTVHKDLQWDVYVYGKPVPSNNDIISKFPTYIQSGEDIQVICTNLQKTTPCEGNCEPDFIDLLVSRGGVIENHKSITAYLDKTNHTVRHHECALLCDGRNKCTACQKYRSTLRAMKSRKESSQSSKTASSSHTNYRYLQCDELKDRLKNVQRSRRTTERNAARLRDKLDRLIGTEGIELAEDDEKEIEELFSHTDEEVNKNHTQQHFQRIFWEQQRTYNRLKNKKRMRWHPLMIRFALNLRYLSSTAYRSVGSFLALPSQRTLRDYTHVMKFDAGVSGEVVKRLKEDMDFERCSSSQKKVTVLMDEMKIKSGLVFNKSTGKLVGFVNLGDINRDLETLKSTLSEDTASPKQPELADSMLVMMVRPIFKPSFTFPIAQYPTTSLSGEKLYPVVWDVIETLELNDIQVHAVSCDGLSANRKFFRISMDPDKSLKIPFKTTNPFDQNRSVYFFCDVPHLLKTTRNCFSNSFSHTNSRHLRKNGKHISWKHVQEVYEKDKSSPHLGIALCPKITKQHVHLTPYSKMRVYLAAQVMSSTMADALTYYDQDETTETRVFIRMIDQFFDCMNVRSKLEGKFKRKDQRLPYTSPKDHRFKWLKDTFLKYLDDWKAEVSALPKLEKKQKSRMQLSRETDEGLHISVLSFCELAPKLIEAEDVEYLLSEAFSQDPLEAYFSRQRHKGGGCDNPGVQQFYYNTASLVQQREVYRDLKTMNVCQNNNINSACDAPLPKRRKC